MAVRTATNEMRLKKMQYSCCQVICDFCIFFFKSSFKKGAKLITVNIFRSGQLAMFLHLEWCLGRTSS